MDRNFGANAGDQGRSDYSRGVSVSGRRGGGNHHTFFTEGWRRSWDTDLKGHRSKDHITLNHNDRHIDLGPDEECDCE